MFSVVNVNPDQLNFSVACINGRMYVCCSECIGVSKECKEPIPTLCKLSVRTVVKLCILVVIDLGVSLVS